MTTLQIAINNYKTVTGSSSLFGGMNQEQREAFIQLVECFGVSSDVIRQSVDESFWSLIPVQQINEALWA